MMEIGKLEFRADEEFWNARYRLNDEVVELGKIRRSFVENDEEIRELFKDLMIKTVSKIIKETSGKDADWIEKVVGE